MGEHSTYRLGPLRPATFLAPALLPFYEAVGEQVGKRLGRAVAVTVGTTFD
jgi:hypothetical protein